MPLELIQEHDNDNVMLFQNITPVDKSQSRPVVNYGQMPTGRLNPDLRNATGESIVQDQIANAGVSVNPDVVGSTDDLDPRDTNKDGEVSWKESVVSAGENAKEAVKMAGSQAGKVVSAGLDYTKKGAVKVAVNLRESLDYDEDGKATMTDLANYGKDIGIATGETIREASGANDVARSVKDSADSGMNTAIMVGGVVILMYAILKL